MTPANELTASTVFLACAWAGPLATVLTAWGLYLVARRAIDYGLCALGRGR
jgi:hypothetical protein